MKDDDENDLPASDDGATVMMGPDETPAEEEQEEDSEEEAEAPLGEQATMLKMPDEPLPVPRRRVKAVAKPAPAPLADDELAISTVITAPKKVTPKAPPRAAGLRHEKEKASPAMKLLAVALATIAIIAGAVFYLFVFAGRTPPKAPAPAAAVEAPAAAAADPKKAEPAAAPADAKKPEAAAPAPAGSPAAPAAKP
ncbi:MAG TPA: hypothetical protein VGK67_09025 [Myxococcales bacterium]